MARKPPARRSRRSVPAAAAAATTAAEGPAPTERELRAIVRGADALVMRAGVARLGLILKGSRAAEIRQRGWDRLPVYGLLADLPLAAIRARIAWALDHGYLQIVRDRGTPLLCLGPAGWELDRHLYVEEILADFEQKAAEPHHLGDYMYLQELNPEILVQVCDEIRRRDAPALAPVLRAWRGFALPPVQRRIDRVLAAFEPRA
jgi:hypothetical protein